MSDTDAGTMVLTLLARRKPGGTVCPSEVARALAVPDEREEAWRAEMAAVHEAVDRLAVAGTIRLSWKGVAMAARAGPYRIRRAGPDGPG